MARRTSKRTLIVTEALTIIAMVVVLALAGGTASGTVLLIEMFLAVFLGVTAAFGFMLRAVMDAKRDDATPVPTPETETPRRGDQAGTSTQAAPEDDPAEERPATKPSPAASQPSGPDDQDAPEGTGTQDHPAIEANPPAQPEAAEPASADATFDLKAFEHQLTATNDPISYLKEVVGDIRTREAGSGGKAPTEFERYLARKLVEAGLLRTNDDLPTLGVVMPHRSDTFYIRIYAQTISLGTAIRVLRLESALNAVLFGYRHFDGRLDDVTVEDLYRFEGQLAASICAQAEGATFAIPSDGDEPGGEWAVRYALSNAIESVQLPHRLTAQFRTNVARGNVALEIDLTHNYLFPTSAYVQGLGVVATTGDMRRIAASQYALRLGILLAACAFKASARVEHVWVAGIIDVPVAHKCYYSVCFEREAFSHVDLAHVDDPVAVFLDAGANLHLMGPQDGSFTYDGYYVHDHAILLPVEQGFDLEDERFCPKRRYDSVTLSPRLLSAGQAKALGTTRVSGLAISEDDERDRVADDIALRLTDSTEKNVRTIMSVAGDDPDLTVRDAAERTISKLISGQLPEEPFAVREEFANGDELTQAVIRARRDIEAHDLEAATRRLEAALAPIEGTNAYDDTPSIAYRDFSSYVERAIYNRTHEKDGRTVLLVPDAYLEAHVLLCFTILGSQGDPEQALAHARRAQELAPLDMRTNLNLVACLELTGDLDAAASQCREELKYAHDPQGIAFGYYRMAGLEWAAGEHASAQACYQRCIQTIPQAAPFVMMELASLTGGDASQIEDAMDDERIEELLEGRDIPVAPTEQVQGFLREGVAASLDAEVFPVAKSFANLLGALSGDDVMLGVVRSLEDVPDR